MKLLPFPRSYKILNEDAYKIFITFKYCVMCAKEENNIQSIDPSVPRIFWTLNGYCVVLYNSIKILISAIFSVLWTIYRYAIYTGPDCKVTSVSDRIFLPFQ